MEQIASISTVEDDVAYGQVNLVELINKVDKGEPKAACYEIPVGAQGDGFMKRRVESFKVNLSSLVFSQHNKSELYHSMVHQGYWRFLECLETSCQKGRHGEVIYLKSKMVL